MVDDILVVTKKCRMVVLLAISAYHWPETVPCKNASYERSLRSPPPRTPPGKSFRAVFGIEQLAGGKLEGIGFSHLQPNLAIGVEESFIHLFSDTVLPLSVLEGSREGLEAQVAFSWVILRLSQLPNEGSRSGRLRHLAPLLKSMSATVNAPVFTSTIHRKLQHQTCSGVLHIDRSCSMLIYLKLGRS